MASDPLRQAEAREWVEKKTGVEFTQEYELELQDGVLLCEVVNTLAPDSINVYRGPSSFRKMENVTAFINALRAMGMAEYDLFTTVDLFELRNIDQVTTTILALKRRTGDGMGNKRESRLNVRVNLEKARSARRSPAPFARTKSAGAEKIRQIAKGGNPKIGAGSRADRASQAIRRSWKSTPSLVSKLGDSTKDTMSKSSSDSSSSSSSSQEKQTSSFFRSNRGEANSVKTGPLKPPSQFPSQGAAHSGTYRSSSSGQKSCERRVSARSTPSSEYSSSSSTHNSESNLPRAGTRTPSTRKSNAKAKSIKDMAEQLDLGRFIRREGSEVPAPASRPKSGYQAPDASYASTNKYKPVGTPVNRELNMEDNEEEESKRDSSKTYLSGFFNSRWSVQRKKSSTSVGANKPVDYQRFVRREDAAQ